MTLGVRETSLNLYLFTGASVGRNRSTTRASHVLYSHPNNP